jgi:hypothetical protein
MVVADEETEVGLLDVSRTVTLYEIQLVLLQFPSALK